MGKSNRTQSETALQRPRETLGMGLAGRQPPLPNKTQTVVQTTRATSGIVSDSAFVAMWFDQSMDQYRTAVSSAIEHCGCRAIIVDQEEFNGFVMDQVIALIRNARFVVADFTCVPEIDAPDDAKVKGGLRGGVYWEAGFAYGLGKPVIHTCQDTEDARRRIHFDVDQYNTIFWRPEDLTGEVRDLSEIHGERSFPEKLASRILADVGRGSYKKSTASNSA